MSGIEMTFVTSSNVESIGYDPDNLELHVTFLNGGHYIYSGVPESIYNGFMSAPSKGTYLDLYIKKGGYHYRKA